MEEKLKDCPYCGGGVVVHYPKALPFVCSVDYIVCCHGCVIQSHAYPTKEAAIKAWNTRAEPNRTQIRKEVCEEILREFPEKMYWETSNEMYDLCKKAVQKVMNGGLTMTGPIIVKGLPGRAKLHQKEDNVKGGEG